MSQVLVVDDDAEIRSFVQAALEIEGYEVFTAVDGAVLPLVRTTPPDVILLDLTMPGMSGEELCAHLRADPHTAAIPVVAMSASTNLDAIACRAGFSDQLAKPFRLPALYAIVARWASSP